MAQIEITDFPSISNLEGDNNYVFYVKRLSDGQDYQMKLGGVKGLITDTVTGSGSELIDSIVAELLPSIESSFEQELEDKVAEIIEQDAIVKIIDNKIDDILGEDFENPYLDIVHEVNNVVEEARLNKKFTKEITLVNKDLDYLNSTTLPLLDEKLVQLNEDLANEFDSRFPITSVDISDDAITAPKIAANSITAEKILAKSIGADQIVANSITGDEIAARTISADKLVANTITANEIAANTITGDLIQANTIDASLIKANAITTDALQAGAITGDKIAGGTITGDLIAANTITSKQLVISDFDNIVDGSNFEDAEASPWEIVDEPTVNIVTDDKYEGDSSLKASPSPSTRTIFLANEVSVRDEDEWEVSFYTKRDSSWNGTSGNSKIRFGDLSNSFIAGFAYEPTTSWTKKTYSFKSTYTGKMLLSLVFDNTAGNVWIDDIVIRRKVNGRLIVDGTITSNQIEAGSISTTQLSATAIDGMLITGALFRTSSSTSVPRALVGDPSFPFWYGQGSVSTGNGIFYTTNSGTVYANNIVIENTGVFKGQLIAATGTFAGDLSAVGGTFTGTLSGVDGTFTGTLSAGTVTGGTITGSTITGANIRTASGTGYRTEVYDDGTYMIWVGNGSKTDNNSLFYVKKNGEGRIKGDFFQGQLLEEKYASSDTPTATATGHLSNGNDVRITASLSWFFRFQTTNRPTNEPNDISYSISRNSTVVKSGTLRASRWQVDPGGETGVQWITRDTVSETISFVDTGTAAGQTYSYTVEMQDLRGGSGTMTYGITLSTYENLVG